MSLIEQLKHFDAYTKPLEDFRIRTFTGGAVTLISGAAILLMFISETVSFLNVDVVEQLYVDSTPSEQRVELHFDISFRRLPCSVVTLDVMDLSGDNQENIKDDVLKVNLDSNANEVSGMEAVRQGVNLNLTIASSSPSTTEVKCGSCYGARDGCCNTCDDVKQAYLRKGWNLADVDSIEQCKSDSWLQTLKEHKNEGCRVYGKVQVAKIAGNFHIAPGDPLRSHRSHFHDLHALPPEKFDTSHIINHLSFGSRFPGKQYPLDGKFFGTSKESAGIMYQYFLKLIPTTYVYLDSARNVFSYQFSTSTYEKNIALGASGLPGFFVQYEFSPLMIKYEEKRQQLSTFLVSLCAIIGGIFTVAGLIDGLLYYSSRAMQKKIRENKLT